MMKKFLLYPIMALLVLAGCKKDDNYVFEQTANERMEAEVASTRPRWKHRSTAGTRNW
ncbi:hypothetical protein MKQ70_20455 [Chitinophaga sedimenti]|uniref:hypothetical protein n=1 Tax=Chitinophaga sedimenti TaxID=2033606 RepID=UPI002005674D|nr:hypothetical protein [Chitinophaga sedimenti]MCK7557247.1 hypothetical protein [Chitinophaga sedimenti]